MLHVPFGYDTAVVYLCLVITSLLNMAKVSGKIMYSLTPKGNEDRLTITVT